MSDQVLFRLKLEPDQDAPAVLGKFVADTKAADAQIVESANSRNRQLSSTFRGGIDEQIRSSSRLSDHQEREAVKAGEIQRREFEKTLKAHQDATRQMEDHQKTFSASTREVNDRLIEAGQGMIQFGMGLAEIGLASEDTAEAMVRGLVRIKGGLDVFEGLVKAYRSLTSLTEVYATATAAAAAATQSAAAANSAAVHAEAAAWEHLTLARTGAAAVAGSATGAGVVARASGGAAGGAAAGATGLTLGAIGAKVGGVLKAGAGYLASGAGAAAALTVGWGTAVGLEAADRLGFGAGRVEGDQREAGLGGLIHARRDAAASTKELEDARQRRLSTLETTARRELRADAETRLLFRGGQAREAALDERIGLANPADQAKLLKEAFTEALRARDAADSLSSADVPKATRAAAADEAGRLTERLKDLAQQRLATEQKILDTAKRASEERKRAAEDELRLVKDRVKVEQDRLKTAAERFGGLSERDQAAARAAITQARRFGEDTLDRNQASLLSSIGTSAATRAAEASNLRRARESGFDRYFGDEERDAIREGRTEARALELQIKTEQTIQAKLELDEAAIVKQTAATVVSLVQEQEARLSKKIEDEVRKLKREIASRTRDQLVGAAATLGGT